MRLLESSSKNFAAKFDGTKLRARDFRVPPAGVAAATRADVENITAA
jgi:hypothetical protein